MSPAPTLAFTPGYQPQGGALGGLGAARSLAGMDPTDKNPYRHDNFKAWQLTRTLAVRTLRATQHKGFRDHPELSQEIRKEAVDIPGKLAYGRHAAGDDCERLFLYEGALGSCLRLQSLLAIASDLNLLDGTDGAALHEGCESARRIISAVINASNPTETGDSPARPIKPSASRGPSRRPPSSGGGSHGDAPWDSRS